MVVLVFVIFVVLVFVLFNSWILVWSDEFDGVVGVVFNIVYWSYDFGNQEVGGWGNYELEYYIFNVCNVQIDGSGMFVIIVEKVFNFGFCWNGLFCGYIFVCIYINGKVSFIYGKVEVCMKLFVGVGIWLVFWMLGIDFVIVGWLVFGEFDIMEFVGKMFNIVYGMVYGLGYFGVQGFNKFYDLGKLVVDDFYIYMLIKWFNEVIWQVDGVEYYCIMFVFLLVGGIWVFEKFMFIIFNFVIGGDWFGLFDVVIVFLVQMKVDWVCVYKEN